MWGNQLNRRINDKKIHEILSDGVWRKQEKLPYKNKIASKVILGVDRRDFPGITQVLPNFRRQVKTGT